MGLYDDHCQESQGQKLVQPIFPVSIFPVSHLNIFEQKPMFRSNQYGVWDFCPKLMIHILSQTFHIISQTFHMISDDFTDFPHDFRWFHRFSDDFTDVPHDFRWFHRLSHIHQDFTSFHGQRLPWRPLLEEVAVPIPKVLTYEVPRPGLSHPFTSWTVFKTSVGWWLVWGLYYPNLPNILGIMIIQ